MTFLTPFALALLALIPPIIALYLLKLRRRDQPVSSVYLWQRFVRDVEANAPWQKLRRNLLLLLQILFMLILILALARPATEAEGVAGQSVVLIMDNSASMAAVDEEPAGFQNLPGLEAVTRLAAAKDAARDLVANLPAEARVTLIAAAGGQADILASASRDRRQVWQAIETIEPAALNSELGPALTLAEAIVAREPVAEIVLFSDGAIRSPDHLAAPVRLVDVGQTDRNQAVSALSVTPDAAGEATLFVQVSNYGRQLARRRLVIRLDGVPFTAFDLDLAAEGRVEQIVAGLPLTARVVEASLTPGEEDALALDDRAWAVLQQAGPTPATLVTSGNYFLQTALSLLGTRPGNPPLDLTVTGVEDWPGEAEAERPSSSNLPLSQRPLYIFDAYVPERLPAGNLLFIAPPASVPGLFEVMGQTGPVTSARQAPAADQPLLRNVNLADTQILTTAVISTAWGRRIIEGKTPEDESIPLLWAGEQDGRRIALLAFRLQHSDLPLRPAFPLLAANLVDYLAPGGGFGPLAPGPGEAVTLSLPPAVDRLRLTGPDGRERVFEAQAGRVTLPPLGQPGLYRWAAESGGLAATGLETGRFAVNFFDPPESSIRPQPDLALAGGSNQSGPAVDLPPAYREWQRPLAAGALILLVVEWLVYQRSAVMRYWTLIVRRRGNEG